MKKKIDLKKSINAISEENPAETFITTKPSQAKKPNNANIPAGYKLVRSEIKNKRVNLVLTQSNFDKLHKFIEKQKAKDPKASINEYFNKHIEDLQV